MREPLEVAIVGGSIAGCAAAIVLSRAGHRVQVFERSRGGLVGRGGGIATSISVMEALIAEDVLDRDTPRLTATRAPFAVRTAEQPEFGRAPWALDIGLEAFHWSTLWRQLRRRVPDGSYQQGRSVSGVDESDADRVALALDDGPGGTFDLVLFADGYRSLGRRLLFPETRVGYRGYMLWRGLLPEGALGDPTRLEGSMPRLAYSDMPGDFVVYLVPGRDGAVTHGRRLCNWAAYIPLPEADVPHFMVDRDGVPHEGTLPPGLMRPEVEAQMKQLMRRNLPSWYADIVERTEDTYVQLIYTVRVPAYRAGRICLIGDAGMVAQPFTGSGVFKGYNNVVGLVAALEAADSLEDALDDWSRQQVGVGSRLLALGEQMEQALIWNRLDLAQADADAVSSWWKGAVTFPEDYSYEAMPQR